MIAGCGQDAAPSGGGVDAAPGCGDHASVSFSHDVAPILGHCSGELCHGDIGPSWPYNSLVNVETMQCDDHRVFVKPGDPTNSYLLQKLEGTQMCFGVRMPKLGDPLPPTDLQTISNWICQGAPNN